MIATGSGVAGHAGPPGPAVDRHFRCFAVIYPHRPVQDAKAAIAALALVEFCAQNTAGTVKALAVTRASHDMPPLWNKFTIWQVF